MSYYNFNDIDKALTELGSNPSGEDALAFIMGTSVGDAMLASRRNQPLPAANPAWDDDIDAAVVRSTWPSGIKRKVPNATGTYYSFSEQPGGDNSTVPSGQNVGEQVFRVVVFRQESIDRLSQKSHEELHWIVRRLGGVASNNRVEMARWIVEKERPFALGGVGLGAAGSSMGHVVRPPVWLAGTFQGGVLSLQPSNEANVVG